MTSESRPTAINKYFRQTPKPPSHSGQIIMLILGGLLVLGGLVSGILAAIDSDFAGALCCTIPGFIGGVVLVIIGGLGILNTKSQFKRDYEAAEPKPSDAQIDEWFNQDKEKIISAAIDKLGLVLEKILNLDDPLVVIGPKSSAKFRIGQDQNIRFSAYEIVVIYLTDYHLGAYSCGWDFVNGRSTSEQTQEYHYTDVVSVSTLGSNTSFNVVTVDGKEHPIQSHQQFSLSVASGESIKVTVDFPQVETIFQQGKLLPTGADKAISALRTMLREKKGGL